MTTIRTQLTVAASGLFGLFLSIFATTIYAAIDTGTLNISATVLDTCEISAIGDVAFGSLTPAVGSGPADAAGSISWACSLASSAEIGIADGDRNLTGTTTPIPYTLWQNSSRSVHWGALASGDQVGVTGFGMTTTTVTPVYGRIAEADYVDADNGSYTDDLLVTIEF